MPTPRRCRHLYSGKVRDIYDAGDDRLLMVTSDRMSAFDVVMAEPIPGKGRVLTAMTAFWLDQLRDVAGSHLISTSLDDLPEVARLPEWEGRVMLCRRAEMLPIECIVRGYLSGSAWKEYKATGTMHGVALPAGLQESDQLPEPVFTPSTKADIGLHDENISFEKAVELVGQETADRAREISLELYRRGSEWAASGGSSSPTPSSSSASSTASCRGVRRGAHARLVAVLARRRVEAGHHPSELRQAAGARLPRRARLGQEPAAAAAARRGRDRVERALHRGVRAHHRSVPR